jgi:thioredoxin-like negative regulator of GroEL
MKLLRFTATWCVFCHQVRPVVEKFAADNGLAIEVEDCTRGNKAADRYAIQALPTVLFVEGERVLAAVRGAHPREAFDVALAQARKKLAKPARKRAVAKPLAKALKKIDRRAKARRG